MSSSKSIEVGNIYKIEANEENKITPPHGRVVWHKHFVVMGKAQDGSVYGCVVFDSAINREYVEPIKNGNFVVEVAVFSFMPRFYVKIKIGNACISPQNFVSLHAIAEFPESIFTFVCRPSNDRLSGGKRLFDGRKCPDEHTSASRRA